MGNNAECCGTDILTCAHIVAIIGCVTSVLTANIIALIIYILVLKGVSEKRPGFLLPAEIFLVLAVIATILINITGIVVGIIFAIKSPESAGHLNPIFIVIFAIVLLIITVSVIFEYIIIHKARNHLLSNQPKHQMQI